MLRYFLLLNWDANLHATRADAMVAIATLFHGDVPLPRYQSLNIAPTARCVTMFNWLQVRRLLVCVSVCLCVGVPKRHPLTASLRCQETERNPPCVAALLECLWVIQSALYPSESFQGLSLCVVMVTEHVT